MTAMRFGLVGTGPWAQAVHGPGLVAAEGADLAGVWGRDPGKAGALAARHGVPAYPSFEALLDDVEAVAFAVPPEVQATLATRAAAAGRHLLLDKPVALDVDAAQGLADTAQEAGVASVVFFTDRFSAEAAAWFSSLEEGRWYGGSVLWLATLDAPGNPYAESPWRREQGALWDIGPHALSTLTAALGPVARVTAVGGRQDLVHLVLGHESGASSTATLSLFAPAAAAAHRVMVWGEGGLSAMPDRMSGGAVGALANAADALREAATTGEPHAADLRLGVRVVELLAEARRQLDG
jgi:predicted dehydrogenase